MDQSLYIFFFIISLIVFLLSIFYDRDYQMQGIFAGISFILFLVLTIQGFNVETIVYDAAMGNFTSYRIGAATSSSSGTMEWIAPVGISLIFAIFSFLNVFIIFTAKAWNKATKGMEMPEGFPKF